MRGGVDQKFLSFNLGTCMSRRHAAHGKAMRIVRGFGGMHPRENFLKRCNLVRFRVYFDQILSLFFFKKYHSTCLFLVRSFSIQSHEVVQYKK